MTRMEFPECLEMLLHAVNLTNSKLAKSINVDDSLVNKWVRGKVLPPPGSRYMDLISGYIAKNIFNSFQRDAINEILEKYMEEPVHEIQPSIEKLLLETHGYSLNLKRKQNEKRCNPINTERIMEKIQESDDVPGKVKIIYGQNEVFYNSLQLLKAAADKKDIPNEPILITYMYEYLYNDNLNVLWKNILWELIQKGWEIIYLVCLNNNDRRNLQIVEDMLNPISSGRYSVYYLTCETVLPVKSVIVPETGALYCFSSKNKYITDSAFLFSDNTAIDLLKGNFSFLFTSAKPLLKSCIPMDSPGFQKIYADFEGKLGRRFCLKSGLGTITIPADLYERYLSRSSISNDERSNKLCYHKERINFFESQIKYYKYREIIPGDCIQKMISTGTLGIFDQHYNCIDNITKEDIVLHLQNTIHLLNDFENFEMAFVDEEQIKSLLYSNWIVKENSEVMIFTYLSGDADGISNSVSGFNITEPNIVKAFETYYERLWDEIEPSRKNKKQVISVFEGYLDKLLQENE